MRRGFWLAAGLGLGVAAAYLVVRRFDRAKAALTPEGFGRSIDRASQAVVELAHDIREAAQAREAELRSSLLHGEPAER
jgi:hypothetical protein